MTPLCRGIFSSGKLSDIEAGTNTNTANLNGSTQYFDAGNTNIVDSGGTDDFSVGLWFKTSYTGGNQRLFTKMNATHLKGYEVYLTSSEEIRLRIKSSDLNTKVTTTANLGLSDDNWHHLLVYSNRAGLATIVIDGAAKSTSYSENEGTVGSLLVTDPYLIGARADISQHFNGALGFNYFSLNNDLTSDSTILYNSGEAPCWYNLPSSIQSKISTFYNLAEWSGNTEAIENQAGAGVLTNINSTPFTGTGLKVDCSTLFSPIAAYDFSDASALTSGAGANDVLGWADYAGSSDLSQVVAATQPLFNGSRIEFDGDDHLSGLPAQAGDFTYIIKFKATSDAIQVLVGDASNTNVYIALISEQFRYRPSSGTPHDTPLVYNNTGPHTVAITKAGSAVKMYIEGVEVLSVSDASSIDLDRVGDRGGSSLGFIGNMYDLLVYDKELTAGEVQQQVGLL